MRLLCFSLNHETADLAVRELAAVPRHEAASLMRYALDKPGIREVLLLCTCNRTELYVIADGGCTPDLAGILTHGREGEDRCGGCVDSGARDSGLLGQFRHSGVELEGAAVIEHLFSLACGMKSLIVGETEILGQLKKAYADALSCGGAGRLINSLFQKTFSVAKEIRSGTRIGRFRVSVASVAVEEAIRRMPGLRGERVSVWGTGPVGRAAVQTFARLGVRGGRVVSRDLYRARTVAREGDGVEVLREDVQQALNDSDVFVSCTGAPHVVITAEMVKRAVALRGNEGELVSETPRRRLLLVDLAVPRDVADDVASISGVEILNLDTLAELAQEHRDKRVAEAGRIRPVLLAEAERFWHCLNASLSEKCLAGWRAQVETAMRAEVDNILQENDLPASMQEHLARVSQTLLTRMLDWPMKAMAQAVREGLPCGDIYPETPLDDCDDDSCECDTAVNANVCDAGTGRSCTCGTSCQVTSAESSRPSGSVARTDCRS